MKILVVDDDPRLRELVSITLERAGYQTITARDGQMALTHALREAPDLVVLDVGLPELDGLEVCRRLRARSDIPILFLTARDDEIDRILGLELGADDYVTKPFSPRELVARIKAILKRSTNSGATAVLRHGPVELDVSGHSVRIDGTILTLTATELSILRRLMQTPEAIVSRPQLIDAIYGAGSPVADRTLDSHLRNLRRKLGDQGWIGAIETVHGIGLRMGAWRG
ncbi:two-component system, OmpR family, response regulator [Ruegeria halocynthiae]|uniref:Two-component system, OmpR family, response regulator n=1 Tax=Ruegeria halocynthiae TaxID=985054 RepID=A0A1H2Y7W8_9RHOB|nr:response regulator transcription factor [Ruegeria halocynthiae]SDX01237.1 two-component system, OmpR family, response regulator [Ruegeria halocynthiae]